MKKHLLIRNYKAEVPCKTKVGCRILNICVPSPVVTSSCNLKDTELQSSTTVADTKKTLARIKQS